MQVHSNRKRSKADRIVGSPAILRVSLALCLSALRHLLDQLCFPFLRLVGEPADLVFLLGRSPRQGRHDCSPLLGIPSLRDDRLLLVPLACLLFLLLHLLPLVPIRVPEGVCVDRSDALHPPFALASVQKFPLSSLWPPRQDICTFVLCVGRRFLVPLLEHLLTPRGRRRGPPGSRHRQGLLGGGGRHAVAPEGKGHTVVRGIPYPPCCRHLRLIIRPPQCCRGKCGAHDGAGDHLGSHHRPDDRRRRSRRG
mmetsp:Transcript_18055/g.36626  ORF Transcript_18055/g.36626 Transcript_18055/m.36626 type:complete len:252 (-) Transcript_18055:958-1713(-)